MTHESIFFYVSQGLITFLGALVCLYVRSARSDMADTKQDVKEVGRGVATVTRVLAGLTERINANEQADSYYRQSNDERVGRASGATSELRDRVARLETKISVCPNCPQANHGANHG